MIQFVDFDGQIDIEVPHFGLWDDTNNKWITANFAVMWTSAKEFEEDFKISNRANPVNQSRLVRCLELIPQKYFHQDKNVTAPLSSLKLYKIPQCPKCTNESLSAHPCPYKSDMNGDYKTLCNCCSDCQEECNKSL